MGGAPEGINSGLETLIYISMGWGIWPYARCQYCFGTGAHVARSALHFANNLFNCRANARSLLILVESANSLDTRSPAVASSLSAIASSAKNNASSSSSLASWSLSSRTCNTMSCCSPNRRLRSAVSALDFASASWRCLSNSRLRSATSALNFASASWRFCAQFNDRRSQQVRACHRLSLMSSSQVFGINYTGSWLCVDSTPSVLGKVGSRSHSQPQHLILPSDRFFCGAPPPTNDKKSGVFMLGCERRKLPT